MKIKENNGSGGSRDILDLLRDRRSLSIWTLRLAAVGTVAALFFATLGFGAYLRKTGDTGYYQHPLLQAAGLDFSFIGKYLGGKAAGLENVDIDIELDQLLRMQQLREQALKNGTLTEEQRKEEFPAKLTYKGAAHDVKLSLAGLTALHLGNEDKFSFEVKASGEDAIDGMKRFGMLLPDSRGYLTDWLGMELMKDRGVMSLQAGFVKASVNGKAKGIFYMEERFDKSLGRDSRLGEGVIFKLQQGVDAYQEKKLMDIPESRDQLLLVKQKWQDVMAGSLGIGEFLDMKKTAQAFAITDLINNRHTFYRFDMRFYFNPATGLAEPLVGELTTLHKNGPTEWSLLLEQPAEASARRYRPEHGEVLKMIFNDLGFKRYYLQEVQALSQEQYMEQFLTERGSKLFKLVNKVYPGWPAYDLPTYFLYENQKYIQSALMPDKGHITAYFEKQEDNRLSVHIRNMQGLPVQVNQLSWRETSFFYPTQPIVLDAGHSEPREEAQVFDFEIPNTVTWADSLLEELKISYNLLGIDNAGNSILVFPWPYEERQAHARNPIVRDANHTSFDFIEEVPETNVISIPKGKWKLDRDLVIPAGHRFEVEAGTRIDLVKHAKVICYSPVYFMGTEQDSILMLSSDKTSEGMIVIRGGERSSVEYTTFLNLNRPTEKGWALTGAVIFYESPVDFNGVAFIGNQDGDDFLNVIRSDFTMEKSLFKDIKADAFDCDFCTGSVANSNFINVGNDGIDISGSEITISHIYMDGIGDKGLSSGEGSSMTAHFVEINNAEIALTSKDRSKLIVSDSKVLNSRVGLTTFMKKPEFGPGFAKLERVKIEGGERPYLIEANSAVTVDGQPFAPNFQDVKGILYGAEYGKASVR